jgi:phosphocarrier protein
VSDANLKISNQRGLHARAAAKLVKLINQFDAKVLVSKSAHEVSGDSILGLMMLAAAKGDVISVCTSGNDEAEVLQAIVNLVNSKFEED